VPASVSAFDDAVAVLRSWIGEAVVIVLEPEGTVMHGQLSELGSQEGGEALFAVDAEQLTGVAVALFADGVRSATRAGDELVVQQGRMTVTVSRTG